MYWIVITGGRWPPQTWARALPLLPPLPRAGRCNQSWLTGPLSGWSYDTCQVKKVTAIDEWYHPGTRWYQSGTRMVSDWYVVSLYTRHIRKYKKFMHMRRHAKHIILLIRPINLASPMIGICVPFR